MDELLVLNTMAIPDAQRTWKFWVFVHPLYLTVSTRAYGTGVSNSFPITVRSEASVKAYFWLLGVMFCAAADSIASDSINVSAKDFMTLSYN